MGGKRLLTIAKTYFGGHYLKGTFGAYPRGVSGDGGPARPGGVFLIAGPKRAGPKVDREGSGFAIKAATMKTKGAQCVCGGSYAIIPGRKPPGPDPKSWPSFYEIYTPRRVYGQGQNGVLVWGEDCTDIRHFDRITYVNDCLWKLTGMPYSFEIRHWKDEDAPGARTVGYPSSPAQRSTG